MPMWANGEWNERGAFVGHRGLRGSHVSSYDVWGLEHAIRLHGYIPAGAYGSGVAPVAYRGLQWKSRTVSLLGCFVINKAAHKVLQSPTLKLTERFGFSNGVGINKNYKVVCVNVIYFYILVYVEFWRSHLKTIAQY